MRTWPEVGDRVVVTLGRAARLTDEQMEAFPGQRGEVVEYKDSTMATGPRRSVSGGSFLVRFDSAVEVKGRPITEFWFWPTDLSVEHK